jgi:hypothetical protein
MLILYQKKEFAFMVIMQEKVKYTCTGQKMDEVDNNILISITKQLH